MKSRLWAAAAASTVLWIISFPVAAYTPNLVPGPVSAVAVWLFLVPLAAALHGRTPGESFRAGYVTGFLANGGVFFWVTVAMQRYGSLKTWQSVPILLLLIAELALYPALTFWAMAKWKTRAPRWLVGALVLTLLEWTRVYAPLEGFPWGTPAYGLYSALPMIQAGDLVGIVGINFLVLLINFVIAETLVCRRERRPIPGVGLGLSAVLFTAFLWYGVYRLSAPELRGGEKQEPAVRVAVLQGNIPQDEKWDEKWASEVLERYQALTAEAALAKPDLIVWPEAALPMNVSTDTKKFQFLSGQAGSADLLVGASTWTLVNNRPRYSNSAFSTGPDGRVKLRYDKQHLVPYGEYVPLSDVLPMYRIVPAMAGNFSKGAPPDRLPDVRGNPYGVLICYEVLFPDLAADRVRMGARFLVNITNDAWFDETSGPFQHVRFGRFRAIETRRFVVRSANAGISTWFDPLGRTSQEIGLFRQGLLVAQIVPSSELTFYVRHPQAATIALVVVLILASLGLFKRHEF
ncbi:MAG: apolipoprotein N-acyltransferase [Pseudomonadota bacterium]